MNNCVLVGRVARDFELKKTKNGNDVVGFVLAVDRREKGKADFISCVAYGKTAELMDRYVQKGHRIGIEGRIQVRSYEKDGATVYVTEVIAESVEFLEGRKGHTDDAGDLPF